MSRKKHSKKDSKSHWILKLIVILIVIIAALFFYRTTSSPPYQKSSKTPVSPKINLPGTYSGSLPCADCPGIKETLVLTATDSAQTQGLYILEDLYLERDPNPTKTKGTWEIIHQTMLTLYPKAPSSQPAYYQILPNGDLEMLGNNMEKIDSPFNQTLTKQPN